MAGGEVGWKACAKCRTQRKKCPNDCFFRLYFPAGEEKSFANVHKLFGANNVYKMLQELPEENRVDAVSSMIYEANARELDPINGCIAEITTLKSQLADKNVEVEYLTVLLKEVDQSNRDLGSASSSNGELP